MSEQGRKLAYSIAELTEISGVGRSFLYEEIKAGRLIVTKAGRRSLECDYKMRRARSRRASEKPLLRTRRERPCRRPAEQRVATRRCSGRDVHFMARPPPRSVRAAFPHTAPASGV